MSKKIWVTLSNFIYDEADTIPEVRNLKYIDITKLDTALKDINERAPLMCVSNAASSGPWQSIHSFGGHDKVDVFKINPEDVRFTIHEVDRRNNYVMGLVSYHGELDTLNDLNKLCYASEFQIAILCDNTIGNKRSLKQIIGWRLVETPELYAKLAELKAV